MVILDTKITPTRFDLKRLDVRLSLQTDIVPRRMELNYVLQTTCAIYGRHMELKLKNECVCGYNSVN